MTHQTTVTYSRQIIQKAVEHFWRRFIAWHGFAVIAICGVGSLGLLLAGDRSWRVGALGALTLLLVTLSLAVYVTYLRRSIWKFERMTSNHDLPDAQKNHVAATRFYESAFSASLALAENLNTQHRYNAVCACAIAVSGKGTDAADLAHEQKERLRGLARKWLAADLRAWKLLFTRDPEKLGPIVAQTIRHWLEDPDLEGLRSADTLSHLMAEEREHWTKLWSEAAELAKQAATVKIPGKQAKSAP